MKKFIFFICVFCLTSFAYAESEPTELEIKSGAAKVAFLMTSYANCEEYMWMQANQTNDMKYERKKELVEKTCECLTDKLSDSVDWDKYATMSDKDSQLYLQKIEQENRNRIKQECKKELNNNIVQGGIAAYKKTDCHEGLISGKEVYDSASTFEKFEIRWDSNVRKSVEERAKKCPFSDNKEFYTVMGKDRTNDVINSISFLFCISLVLIIVFLSKNKKN